MDVKDLKKLLNNPTQLQVEIEKLRLNATISEEVKGFIILYDSYEGNCEAIYNYLKATQSQILAPLQVNLFPFYLLKCAAVIAFIIGLGGFLCYYSTLTPATNKSSINSEKKEFFTEPGLPIYMGEATTIEWGKLMFAMKKESPSIAIIEWQKLYHLNPDNDTVIYFGGIIFFNANQLKKAAFFLKQNKQKQSVFNDRSLYYLALIDLKRNSLNEANKKFHQLSSTKDLELKKAVNLHLQEVD
jgi:hypothetical protein